MIRIANKNDIDEINELYEEVIGLREKGIAPILWTRGIYPTREYVERMVNAGEMYVLVEEGKIAAAAIYNQVETDAYSQINWNFNAKSEEILVMHTLAVHPAFMRRGLAKRMLAFYEELAEQMGCIELRIDTNDRNMPARDMYRKAGYTERGLVETPFNGLPSVRLICLEKTLEKK